MYNEYVDNNSEKNFNEMILRVFYVIPKTMVSGVAFWDCMFGVKRCLYLYD